DTPGGWRGGEPARPPGWLPRRRRPPRAAGPPPRPWSGAPRPPAAGRAGAVAGPQRGWGQRAWLPAPSVACDAGRPRPDEGEVNSTNKQAAWVDSWVQQEKKL